MLPLLHYSKSGDPMKLSIKKAKLITTLLLGFYLVMLFCGFYSPFSMLCFPLLSLAALGLPYLFNFSVGFLKEKLCIQLLN